MSVAYEDVITLADGRALAYRQHGDPTAPTVLFQPGFMACRLSGRPAPEVNARIITVDRPGIGRSDPKADRTVLGAASDIAELADRLAIGRFAVLGHSAGAPYAAACAYRLEDRVTMLGIACGFAPMDRPRAGEGMNARMAKALPSLRRAPWIARLATMSLPRQYRRDPAKAFDNQFGRDLPECDRRALSDNDTRQAMLDAAVEATARGARQLATEMQLTFSRPWGFAPSSIKTPTRLWYGAADTLTPLPMGRYLARQIPDAELIVHPDEGHMALINHWDDIISVLTPS